MLISVVSEAQARGLFEQALGGTLAADDAAVELLRQEVTARGRHARHSLIANVCRLAAPAVALDLERVDDLCEDLERQGDLLLGDGGVVYPSPVRIVALGDGVFRFVCAIPSHRLFANVPGDWTRRGVRRDCRLRDPAADVARALGGVALTPETWAGFDRVPPADDDWLRYLDARRAAAPVPAGVLERDEPLDWKGLVIDDAPIRWRSAGPARLWRARHRWKRWVYAWTAVESPSAEAFVELRPDEGARTVFAAARAAGQPVVGSITRTGDDVSIAISQWLPQAEHRYLSTRAEPIETATRDRAWTVSAARSESVIAKLVERLGVRLEQEGPA
ncbi:MAG: hypothetical protein IPH44_20100 [Myxococcales bacterium]|nr:hypothetical protein [Myxococcales bacterium]